ncbi:hypothetical protein RUM44_010781 [Polyplax serrata]|uniref:Uncharacterized protein n=1 Tax=Polyplax serrata TaxID=468196 RepID=A0ABR1AN58_POLSC
MVDILLRCKPFRYYYNEGYKFNYTLTDILLPDSNNYLNFDFNAFWSHNESYYLSKLDDLDVINFQGTLQLTTLSFY